MSDLEVRIAALRDAHAACAARERQHDGRIDPVGRCYAEEAAACARAVVHLLDAAEMEASGWMPISTLPDAGLDRNSVILTWHAVAGVGTAWLLALSPEAVVSSGHCTHWQPAPPGPGRGSRRTA